VVRLVHKAKVAFLARAVLVVLVKAAQADLRDLVDRAVSEEIADRLAQAVSVVQVQVVLLVQVALLDQAGLKALVVLPVYLARLEKAARLVRVASEAIAGLLVLVALDKVAHPAQVDCKAIVDHLGREVKVVLLDQVVRVVLVRADHLVKAGLLASVARKEEAVLLARVEHKVPPAQLALQDHRVLLALVAQVLVAQVAQVDQVVRVDQVV